MYVNDNTCFGHYFESDERPEFNYISFASAGNGTIAEFFFDL